MTETYQSHQGNVNGLEVLALNFPARGRKLRGAILWRALFPWFWPLISPQGDGNEHDQVLINVIKEQVLALNFPARGRKLGPFLNSWE